MAIDENPFEDVETDDKPRTYTEDEVQEILRRSGINKRLVAATVIGVYDNGEGIVQHFYHEAGIQVVISKLGEAVD